MEIALMIMISVAMFMLYFCGFYSGVIKEKYGKNWLQAVPITVAVLMFNIIWILTQLIKSDRFQ
ncbi:hypothetical protein KDN24_16385 [Bacillus sp. Bva_UNVM-123]|uniref:hypothetical protein n=1 Tax=Bacillus sp. Bva_UNVM-123 TaxID=2829798 RepID=UPI00391F3EBE